MMLGPINIRLQIGCLILNLFDDDIWVSDWN